MCGRYVIKSDAKELAEQLHLDEAPPFPARYNVAPTQAAPIVLDSAPRALSTGRWGFLPKWAKRASEASKWFNARTETLTQKAFFHEALTHRRCLVPADGFYEWKHHGQQRTPLYITRHSHRLLTFAGLWAPWRSPDGLEVVTFTIITTAANPFMASVHERMPAVLDEAARALWLSPTNDPATLVELLKPWAGEPLEGLEVSPKVGSVDFDDPHCLDPATTVQLSLL